MSPEKIIVVSLLLLKTEKQTPVTVNGGQWMEARSSKRTCSPTRMSGGFKGQNTTIHISVVNISEHFCCHEGQSNS